MICKKNDRKILQSGEIKMKIKRLSILVLIFALCLSGCANTKKTNINLEETLTYQ